MKTDYFNTKFEPNTKYYCWENSDYVISIRSRSATHAIVNGLIRTKEHISKDEQGNEYIRFTNDFGRNQTYYAFAKC